jgi:hypothetical protein
VTMDRNSLNPNRDGQSDRQERQSTNTYQLLINAIGHHDDGTHDNGADVIDINLCPFLLHLIPRQ